jgi:hypothetical protein
MLEDVRGLSRQAPNLIVGCVDSHTARRTIAEYMAQSYECCWIDAGNEAVAGQVILGYTGPPYRAGIRAGGPIEVALPTVSQLVPLPLGGEGRPSCAELQEVTQQVSTVNVMAAALIANFVRLVLEDVKRGLLREPVRGLDYHGVYFNVGNGGFRTLWNTPETLAKARNPLCPWQAQ